MKKINSPFLVNFNAAVIETKKLQTNCESESHNYSHHSSLKLKNESGSPPGPGHNMVEQKNSVVPVLQNLTFLKSHNPTQKFVSKYSHEQQKIAMEFSLAKNNSSQQINQDSNFLIKKIYCLMWIIIS